MIHPQLWGDEKQKTLDLGKNGFGFSRVREEVDHHFPDIALMVAPTQRLYSFAELGEALPQSSGRAYASPLVLVRWSKGMNRELPAGPIPVVQLLPVNFSCRRY